MQSDEIGNERTVDDRSTARRVAAAIFWSFLGIRRGSDYDSDVARITPVQAIAGGIVGAALFVALLLSVVHVVTH